MSPSSSALRLRAAACITQARASNTIRAAQLRATARTFTTQALRIDLAEHSRQVGHANVTQASFHAYLRRSGLQRPQHTAATEHTRHDLAKPE